MTVSKIEVEKTKEKLFWASKMNFAFNVCYVTLGILMFLMEVFVYFFNKEKSMFFQTFFGVLLFFMDVYWIISFFNTMRKQLSMLESESKCTNQFRRILNVTFTFVFLMRAFAEDILRPNSWIKIELYSGKTKWASEMYTMSIAEKFMDYTLYFQLSFATLTGLCLLYTYWILAN